jgi:predicted transcriptional regulator
MTTRRPDGGFGESSQTRFEATEIDLTDPDLIEALDCVAQEPGSSGGHPPDSLAGRRAQLAYLNARIEEGLRASDAGDVLSVEETTALLQALEEGRAPPIPKWVTDRYGR